MGADTDLSIKQTYGAASTSYDGSRGFPDIPGDKKIAADGGAYVLLGQEGYVELAASPLAKLILGNLMNFCRIVCREFEIISDFGTLRLSNGTNGRCGLSIEGGGSYTDEAKASGSTSTTRFFMGDVPDAPDARLGFSVNSTDSGQQGGFVIGKDGTLKMGTSGDHLLSIGGKSDNLIQGDCFREVDGNRKTLTKGSSEDTISQDSTKTIAGQKQQSIGGDYNLQVAGVLNIGADGINLSSMNVSGTPVTLRCSSLDIVKA